MKRLEKSKRATADKPETVEQIRTCLVCSREAVRDALVRFVILPDGRLAPDILGRAPGRGYYACPTPECIGGLSGSGRLKKALGGRQPGLVPAEAVTAVRLALTDRAKSLVSLARRSGRLAIGAEESTAALREGRAAFVAVASDSGSGAEGLAGGPCVRMKNLDKVRLGALFGEGRCAALAVCEKGLGRTLKTELSKLDDIEGGASGIGG
jgi:predicted RNA-binding protein YlxR (DUF448 family)